MRKYRFSIWLTMLLLLGIMLFLGCSANQSSLYPGAPELDSAPAWKEAGTGDYGFGNDAKDVGMREPSVSPTPGPVERKFVENGRLELRSLDVDKTFNALSNLATSLGGRVVSYEQNVGETFKTISMQVAVPYGKLTDFMEHAGETSTKIEAQSVTSDEVTEEYYDTKVRIESTENLIEHYRSLLKNATTIEETLQVQSRIDELTVELESLKGRFRLLEYLTEESHISITIRMEQDPTVAKPDVSLKTLKWSDVGYLMKTGLQRVGIVIALGFQYLLIFLVYASPLFVLAFIALLIVKLVHRRNKKRKMKAASAAIESKESPQQLGEGTPAAEVSIEQTEAQEEPKQE